MTDQADNLVNLAVPAQYYPKMLKYLVGLMAEDDTAENSESLAMGQTENVESILSSEWSEEELRRLWGLLAAENTVGLAVLDMCARQPGIPVSYPDACQNANVDVTQGRAHIAAFTKVCNKIRKGEWPVNTGWADGGNYRCYEMTKLTSERWLRVRSEPKRRGALTVHKWTYEDELIAYCLCRLGQNERSLGIDVKELGTILGMGYNSLALKIGNFKAIEGNGGLDGYSRQALEVHTRYSSLPDSELRALGVEAVGRALNRYSNAA